MPTDPALVGHGIAVVPAAAGAFGSVKGWAFGAYSFDGPGAVIPWGSSGAVGAGAYDTLLWDSDGFTGTVVSPPISPVGSPDNYLAGTGLVTIPAGGAGLYRLHSEINWFAGLSGATPANILATVTEYIRINGVTWQGNNSFMLLVNQVGAGGPATPPSNPQSDYYFTLAVGDTVQVGISASASGWTPAGTETCYAWLFGELVAPA